MDDQWIEHRRGRDGELLGWIAPEGEGFVAIDLLGRPRTAVVDWLRAEEVLDELGIGYLADPYELHRDHGGWRPVRITEVSRTEIRLKQEDGGAIDGPRTSFSVPVPAPAETLRPRSS